MHNEKMVAVVVPIHKEYLSSEEKISLAHLRKYLSKHKKFIVCPQDLKLDFEDFELKSFDKSYFNNTKSYSKLLLSDFFYKTFSDYKFILIYQLDCLVFSDDLLEWCFKDYDYVGSPWLLGATGNDFGYEGVGNGGFSLRKVKTFLQVLSSYKKTKTSFFNFLLRPREFLNTSPQNSHEDVFWSFEAENYIENFKKPTTQEALSFGFELDPSFCFKKNDFRLPFGCHAWSKYDKEFWGKYITISFD